VIVASFGDVDTLGEAYAFGVILVVRLHDHVDGRSAAQGPLAPAISRAAERSYPKQKQGEIDIPIGIFTVFLILASTALIIFSRRKRRPSGVSDSP